MLGGKWKLLIIYQLLEGPLRFSELSRRIPDISEKMLTQELAVLIDSQLVHRHDYGQSMLRVEYQLTELGRDVFPLIEAMRAFGLHYRKHRVRD
jgi:DNA-binding HxlR family transcriptional regulator